MFFNNLKVKTKLILAFMVIVAFLAAIVVVGVTRISRISSISSDVYENNIRPLDTLEQLKAEFANLRRYALTTVVSAMHGDQAEIEQAIKNADAQYVVLMAAAQAHLNLIANIKGSQAAQDSLNSIIKAINNEYWPINVQISNAAQTGDTEAAIAGMLSAVPAANRIDAEINEAFAKNMLESSQNIDNITYTSNNSVLILVSAGIAAALLSIIIAMGIGGVISKQITRLRKITKEIAAGNLEIEPTSSAQDEIGDLTRDIGAVVHSLRNVIAKIIKLSDDFKKGLISSRIDTSDLSGSYKNIGDETNNMFITMIGDMLTFFDSVEKIAVGNFNISIAPLPGEKIVMNEAFESIKNTLQSVVRDISSMAAAASEGNLSDRITLREYKGDWAELMASLNTLMEAVYTPIHEAESVLEKVSAGNFDFKIMGAYRGEFLNIKESVNHMVENINSYISEISGVLSKMAKNDFTVEIEREYVGKFSDIKSAVNYIISRFNSILSEITAAAEQVAGGARQISESSVSLAQGASEQAAAVQELNATIALINEATLQNAGNARDVEIISERSMENAARGGEEMKNMLVSMDGIKQSSTSISKIINVIDEIAFQTNLLALNAAIEAAHAGIHGQGFTVVAEEVGNLAARSQNAARETAQLIEESINRVSEGTRMADITASALKTIIEDVTKVAELIKRIAESSSEQAAAISQVMSGLIQITDVVQKNSSTSEEAASSSEELTGQSAMLRRLVEVFRLKQQAKEA